MKKIWNQAAIQQYIDDEIQESLILDYKGANSLGKTNKKRDDITKDISSFANSSGGTIIYGVKEYDDEEKKHLPERIDPISQKDFSREWLDQVINNIRPRIEGVVIHPVQLDTSPNHVAYVVEIPQSTTAHQATNKKYYKRFNFMSVEMEDYEIRDTMGRQKFPKIDLDFEIEIMTKGYLSPIDYSRQTKTVCNLYVISRNIGSVYAQYVNFFVRIPLPLLNKLTLKEIEDEQEEIIEDGDQKYYEYFEKNTVRDVVDVQFRMPEYINKYGPSRYDPILPGLSHTWEIELNQELDTVILDGLTIKWSVFADNAPENYGIVPVADIRIVDRRKSE